MLIRIYWCTDNCEKSCKKDGGFYKKKSGFSSTNIILTGLMYYVWFHYAQPGDWAPCISSCDKLQTDRLQGPDGFHISWLSPVFWPADRKQPNWLRLVFSMCVVCMKPCRVLSWSQVQSRQPRRCLAVEIVCVEITAAEKLFMLTFWQYLSNLTGMPAVSFVLWCLCQAVELNPIRNIWEPYC